MEFPSNIPLRDLSYTHEEFDAKLLEEYEALYKGGEEFAEMAREFLVRRPSEFEKPQRYEERLKKTPYIPHATVVDYLVAAVFTNEPKVVYGDAEPEQDPIETPSVSDPTNPEPQPEPKPKSEPMEPEENEYWSDLNRDVDGDGTDLPVLARNLLLDTLLYGRAWLQIFFNDDDPSKARLQHIPCSLVDDHGEDEGSDWVRIHTKAEERDLYWGKNVREVERWSFCTNTETAHYEYVKDLTNRTPRPEQIANLVEVVPHQLEICPVIEVKPALPGVMGRIKSILVALYNRESALTFSLDQGCYSLLVFKTQSDIKTILSPETSAVKLAPGEDAAFISPNTLVYDSGFKDLDRLRTELARSVHGLSLEAAAQVQAPRQGAFAAQLQRGPMEALLATYASCVRDALEKAFTAIATYRNEDPRKVHLLGMDDFNADLEKLGKAIGQGEIEDKEQQAIENESDPEGSSSDTSSAIKSASTQQRVF